MSTGRVIGNMNGQKAREPQKVVVSDGSIGFPYGHPDYFVSNQPDGMLLLDLSNNEYSEFRLDSNRDCEVHLYNHMNGARYKLFVYRTSANPVNITFFNGGFTYVIAGTENPARVVVLNIEVVDLQGVLINKIGPTSEQIDEVIASLNTSSIKLSEDIQFNGVEQGAYRDGDTMAKDETLTAILKKFAARANPVSYFAPAFGIVPNSTSLESGTLVQPSIVPSWSQNDAGPLNRYLLQLSTAGAGMVSLVDGPALQNFNQPEIQIQDGLYLDFLATAFYDEGETKLNNLGEPDPTGKILAGSKTDVLRYTGQRQAFFQAQPIEGNPSQSNEIRALSGTRLNPSNGTSFSIAIPAGTKRIVIAYPASLRDVTSVKYVELGNAEVGDTFQLVNINVEGANGYNPIPYKVWVYTPAVPFGSSATYNVTI